MYMLECMRTYAQTCADNGIQKHTLASLLRTAFNAFHGYFPSGWPVISLFKSPKNQAQALFNLQSEKNNNLLHSVNGKMKQLSS